MDKKFFNRVEKKYIIDDNQYKTLLKEINKNMKKDEYFRSDVFNIYFDTDNFDLIIQSIDNPLFKEKLRARSYGGYDKVFLEIKTKIRGAAYRRKVLREKGLAKDTNLGYKRRILITKKEYEKFSNNKITAEELIFKKDGEFTDLQVAREIDYIIKHFNLKPKLLNYYDRESFTGENSLRITFDKNLRFRDKNLRFLKKNTDEAFLKNEKNIIMEIKAGGVLPLWLVKLLSAEHIYPTHFSKIGKIYEKLRKEKNV